MKQPIALLITDTHLSEKNTSFVEGIWQQCIDKCKELNIDQILFGGDFFDSRKAQPLAVLKSGQRILENIKDNELSTLAIVGNHDKTDYDSVDSYMDVLDSEDFEIINEYHYCCPADNIRLHFLPYFKEESGVYLERLRAIKTSTNEKNILFTHIAINGSTTNDNEHVSNCIPSNEFAKFDTVFTGHFHNRNEFENIVYIGSPYQANFGEDDNKGFSVLYDDGSYEFTQSTFPKYIKHTTSIEDITPNLLSKLESDRKGGNHVRLEIDGKSEKLKSFDRSILTDIGVEAVLKPEEAVLSLSESKSITYDKKSITEGFKEFCEENEVKDIEYGLEKMKEL